jgi:hypothetical protein
MGGNEWGFCFLQLKDGLSRTLEEEPDTSLPLCWKGQEPFKSVLDVRKEFKSLVLNFASGKKTLMEIPPENYLIVTVNIAYNPMDCFYQRR